MTAIFLGAVSLMYIGAGLSYYLSGNKGMALSFVCYAIANYGIYIGSK